MFWIFGWDGILLGLETEMYMADVYDIRFGVK
jgi:hypothetical protein